jgi:hypothetical protein
LWVKPVGRIGRAIDIPTPGLGSCGSVIRFRSFEAEEVNVAASVAGDDQLGIIGQCATEHMLSQVNVARTSPFSSRHTFSVLSHGADTASRPSLLKATPATSS